MDLSQVTDIKELKALAYDQLSLVEQAQLNIRKINQRIAELSQPEEKPKDKNKKSSS